MHNRKNKEELFKSLNDKLNEGYNFVDYFLTIGSNPNIFQNKWLYESDISELNNKYKEEIKPIIINKFPSNDKKIVGLDEAIILHCFPNGFEIIESNTQPEYKIYSILLDNNNYSISYQFKYVVCLKFYESINKYKKIYDKYMEFSEMNMPEDSDIISTPTHSKERKATYSDIYCPMPLDGDQNNEECETNISNNYGISRSSHKDFKINSCKENFKYRKYYIPKCLCLISLYPYITELSKIIKIIYQYSLVEKQIIPLEKIINNLIIEVPTPPRGIYSIEYSLINESITLKANQMNELYTLNIEFERLFTIFNLNNILEIFQYLMLNTKIIIFSKEIKNLTPVILSLLSLLYPFHYPYTVVSVLHKEAYKLIDNIVPVLVGINEKYNSNFLKENDIDICDFTLIVNMDKQELIKMEPPDMKNKNKKLPSLPQKYKNNLENKINNYILEIKKNKKKNGRGEHPKVLQHKIRTFFLEFQIELMKDYSKYLDNDIYKHQDDGKTPLENAFKLKEFLNKIPSDYHDFYEYFLGTQMFCDFIYKRMMPRDKNEQIDILYFEEKLLKNKSESIFLNSQNYKIEKKFGVKKPTPLSSEQIDYFNNFGVRKKLISNGIEVVNRKDTFYVRGKSFTISKKPTNIDNNSNGKNNGENLDNNDDELFSDTNNERKTMSFHNNNNNMDMGMKSKEELRMSQKFKSTQPLFTYYIFPKLNNDYFYKSDIKNYYIDFSIYQEVKNIDNELLSKSHLSRVEIKTNEATNYIHLIWLKMWVSTFYYQDKQEQKYRFLQMLNILDKINQHEMGVINNLFTVLVNNQIDEDLLLLLYDKILHYQLIPSNFIFKTIRKLINNKKNKLKLKAFNISKYLSSISDQLTKDLKEIKKLKKNFRKRTMRSIYDTQILDEKISFLVEENCSECDKKITMYQLIKNLNEINNDLLWAKCPYCGYNYLPKLKVKFGTENNKNNRLKLTTSIVDDVILYSPKTLNYNMFDNTKTNININLEEFKSNYNPFFWNIIWYFKMKKLPFDFILPYEDNILHYLINNKQKIIDEKNADEDLNKKKESLFFKMNFCNYVKKAKEELRNKKKNFYNKNELIMCINEIDVYIPPRSAFSSRHASFNDRNDFILRSNTNTSRISDYHSVINVNDFQNTSQLNLERDSFGSQKHINSVKKNYNIYINNEISVNNTFNSSLSIIKIKPNRKRSGNDYISDSTKGIGYLNKSNNKNKMSYSLHYKNNDKLKPLDINDSNLMDKQLKNSYQNTIPNSNLGDYQY